MHFNLFTSADWRQHLLINLQSATVDPLPMCSVKICKCEIYPVQVSLALPPPAPQGQSPAPCLHCWQVSKSLAVGCSCARHRHWGKGRSDYLQPGTHKQFKLKKATPALHEDLKLTFGTPLRYHHSVTVCLFSADIIGNPYFTFSC